MRTLLTSYGVIAARFPFDPFLSLRCHRSLKPRTPQIRKAPTKRCAAAPYCISYSCDASHAMHRTKAAAAAATAGGRAARPGTRRRRCCGAASCRSASGTTQARCLRAATPLCWTAIRRVPERGLDRPTPVRRTLRHGGWAAVGRHCATGIPKLAPSIRRHNSSTAIQ